MGNVIGITGTPGTGKKSVAPLVASMLGLACLSMPPKTSRSKHAEGSGEFEVDTEKARQEITRRPPRDVVAYGHLLPYVLPGNLVTRVVVLRCEPMVLKDRLLRRGYSMEKTVENVEAELIGVIPSDAVAAFGREKTLEFDTSASTVTEAAQAVVGLLRGQKKSPVIDWMPRYGSSLRLRSLLSS